MHCICRKNNQADQCILNLLKRQPCAWGIFQPSVTISLCCKFSPEGLAYAVLKCHLLHIKCLRSTIVGCSPSLQLLLVGSIVPCTMLRSSTICLVLLLFLIIPSGIGFRKNHDEDVVHVIIFAIILYLMIWYLFQVPDLYQQLPK
jgi:hypothetical protein